MSPSRLRARRTKSSAATRLRKFWIVIAVAICMALVGIGVAITWPGFQPRAIVVSGNRSVSRAEILERAGISTHVNMWLQNPRAIAARIASIPNIGSVRVYPIPPATVRIWVEERTPFAIARAGTQEAVLDRDLRVLADDAPVATLPIFFLSEKTALVPGTFLHQTDALALRNDNDTLLAAHVVPIALSFDRYGGLIAILRGGIKVLFGDGDFEKKVALVNPILAQVGGKRRIAAVDLRAPNTPVVQYR